MKLKLGLACLVVLLASCGKAPDVPSGTTAAPPVGQSGVKDDLSDPNIVQIAVGSPDHTTLVAAVQAAQLVDALSNAGPFTVFAPVNAAFDALPAGTLETLLKPENQGQLKTILYHHVTTSAYTMEMLKDGEPLGMVDGTRAVVSRRDGQVYLDKARILGSVKASNGMVIVVDAVILPPAP